MSSVAQLEAEKATGRGAGYLKRVINSLSFKNIKLKFYNLTGQAELVTPENFVSLSFSSL